MTDPDDLPRWRPPARPCLREFSVESIANEVEGALLSIGEQELREPEDGDWEYADTYTAALDLLGSALDTYFEDLRFRLERGQDDRALIVCEGILLGVYSLRNDRSTEALRLAGEEVLPSLARSANRDFASIPRGRGRLTPRRRPWRVPRTFLARRLSEWVSLFHEPKRAR